MAPNSTWKPYASLTDAPTNLKEAIDWVLRVTGKDGKALSDDECICGLAAAVTDLLQSVQLEYHGYQGDTKEDDTTKGATEKQVKDHLNELFSLVQGLGGTAVVRTYIDQLAQVLSALVGWSKIEKCDSNGKGSCNGGGTGNQHGKDGSCEYLKDVQKNDPCKDCGCMKWNDPNAKSNEGHHLGRRCKRCSGSGGSAHRCSCTGGGGTQCTAEKCQCAKEGKCCKCCCNGRCGKCKKECSCVEEEQSYRSAYPKTTRGWSDGGFTLTWAQLVDTWMEKKNDNKSASQRRHQCARIFLGSVCLIWSGITYMYWTGKYHWSSPRWNNHILDGSGLDDGTLSQWLQALGFPVTMLNNHGPGNRWDAIIWDGFRDMLFLGFPDTKNGTHGKDDWHNTFRDPAMLNYPGFIHTLEKGAFDSDVFKENGKDINKNKLGAIFKLYILSCAYFTGLQKKAPPQADNKTPRTIREILYWLSALPYSPAYKDMLDYAKERLKKEAPDVGDKKQLSFYQTGRKHPITVDEYNLFAHFQAVTQYCPLVLIGIQGGFKGTDNTKEPAIHSLYANTECQFTYPSVPIQAYNQVVHYIRALFYQLYFLRKQCAVKVALGGKWRECRYGSGVIGRDAVSWMCLGCDPMEHDRKSRVGKVGTEILKGIKKGSLADKLKDLVLKIGNVVVQLGNAQEALEEKKGDGEIKGVKEALQVAKEGLDTAKNGLNGQAELTEAKGKLDELTKSGGGGGKLGEVVGKIDMDSSGGNGKQYDPGKNKISEAIKGVREALEALKNELKKNNSLLKGGLADWATEKFQQALDHLKDICTTPKCPGCKDHSTKCGQNPVSKICNACHQQYMDGFPSPLQAFLEDRLPGFSCNEVLNTEDTDKYPPAASHLGHCNGSGQCCPLPMGFRGHFQGGSTTDCTGQRLYGILYFFSNENMMQSCVYTLVRVTAALSATTPQVLGDVFGFFRGGVGNPVDGKPPKKEGEEQCGHDKDPSKDQDNYFCGWCASGLRDEVKNIEWIPKGDDSVKGGKYRGSVGEALIDIKGDKGSSTTTYSSTATANTSLSRLTKNCQYLSPLTGELYTAVSATFGGTYLSWVLYLSDALHSGLESLASEFKQIECRGCKGQCDPNKCKKGEHGQGSGQCGCQSIVSCTGVLPVLYRHGFSYGNPFNLEGYHQKDGKDKGDYSIKKEDKSIKHCHEFLDSISAVIKKKEEADQKGASKDQHPLSNLLSQVGKLQYDIRLPWIFVLTVAWLVAVLYLAFGAIWPLDWTHMRSHWLRGGAHQWQCMWYKVMTGRKGMELVEYFGRK